MVAYMYNRETLYAQTDYNNMHTKIYVFLLLRPHNPVTVRNTPEYTTYIYSSTKPTQTKHNTIKQTHNQHHHNETDYKLNARIAQPNQYKYIKSIIYFIVQ